MDLNKGHQLNTEFFSILKKRLTDPTIKCAFIFSSITKYNVETPNDIDLVIISDLRIRSLVKLLSGVQGSIGCEINPYIFTEEEFMKRIQDKDYFISRVLRTPIVPILGNLRMYM